MKIERRNPSTIHAPGPYSHAVIVNQGRVAYLAGQVAFDKDGNLVGEGDLETQLNQAMRNIKAILQDLGSDLTHIIKITTYIADYSHDQVLIVRHVLNEYFAEEHRPANTLLGVQSLAQPGLLVELEATVALDD